MASKTKTAQIAERLHQLIKLEAARTGKKQQELTEELLRDGLKARGIETDDGLAGDRGRGTNQGKDEKNAGERE